MVAFADAGITTFDCADIYTGVEELIGALPARAIASCAAPRRSARLKVHTKFVPDLDVPADASTAPMSRASSTSRCSGSARSGSTSCSSTGGTMTCRAGSRPPAGSPSCRRAGKIDRIGATNFDTDRTARPWSRPACRWSRMQVQYSLLDTPPGNGAAAGCCGEHGVALLCYGTVAGGFLSDRWLGVPEPSAPLREPLADQIQADHRRFRRLGPVPGAAARRCARIADRHATDIATVASAAVLARPGVAAVIVGARNRAHLGANARDLRDSTLERRGSRRDRGGAVGRAAGSRATSTRSSATAAAATARS